MKYIITENRLEKIVLHFLNEKYGDLTAYKNNKNPSNIYWMGDGHLYMLQFLKNNEFSINESIWEELKEIFSLKNDDIKLILTKWVEEAYNITGVEPKPLKDWIKEFALDDLYMGEPYILKK